MIPLKKEKILVDTNTQVTVENRTKVVLDTNILLDNPEVLLRTDIKIVLPYITLAELDKLKRNPDLSFPARKAIKLIKEAFEEGKIEVVDIPKDLDTNDEKIVASAKREGALLYSHDVGANVIALTNKVGLFADKVKTYDHNYIGYRYVPVDSEFYYNVLNKVNELQHPEVEEPLEVECSKDPFNINEYFIFTPTDESANLRIFRKTVSKYEYIPDGNKHYKGINQTTGKNLQFGFLHPEQAIAFDAVFNTDTPLAVIHGKIGSGKTLLATIAALARVAGNKSHKKYESILVTRPNRPINKIYELGFMPGDLNAKMGQWLSGFTSNLEFLFNHTLEDIENGSAQKIFENYFSPIAIESIQGFSFNNKIMICDEAQLLDVDTMRQLMSRAANGSKLILIMDSRQTYGANRGNEGYKKLLPHMKNNPIVSYIDLQFIQRSELTSFVNDIFE